MLRKVHCDHWQLSAIRWMCCSHWQFPDAFPEINIIHHDPKPDSQNCLVLTTLPEINGRSRCSEPLLIRPLGKRPNPVLVQEGAASADVSDNCTRTESCTIFLLRAQLESALDQSLQISGTYSLNYMVMVQCLHCSSMILIAEG